MAQRASLAKISRPRLFGVVARERLYSLLDENRGRPLVWISGPPGAGKTALVASYLESRELPTIWYQIDAGDADPATLFHYLALAAEAIGSSERISLPRFVPEHLSDLPGFAHLFFRAFFAQLPERLTLVFDNYQEASEHAALHGILRQAIADVPPDSSVIAISRVEAPPDFVQLAASGAMVNIGWEKLQLTLEEVRAIAEQRRVTDEWLLKALHQQSQGWAAGITLMLERLGHFDGKTQELPSDTRESVFNYFASLIFDQASAETRHILLSIAFLPRVTASLACNLSGKAEAPLLLESLYRRRMFTDRRQAGDPIYQFHALFLDFLREKARETLHSSDCAELILRSAHALEATGEVDSAMDLWVAAQAWDRAVELILKEAGGLMNAGRRQTLLRWIDAIPNPHRESHPWLMYWYGSAQLQIQPEEGLRTLQSCAILFRECKDPVGHVLCLTALLGGGYIGYAAMDAMDEWIDELLAQVSAFGGTLSLDMQLKVWGVLGTAMVYVRPWHALAGQALQKVERLLPRSTDDSVALTAAIGAISFCMLTGELERGERIAEMTKNRAERVTASPSEAAWWFCQVGYLKFVQAQYGAALDTLRRAVHIAEAGGVRTVLRDILLHRATVEYRAFGWAVADATLTEIEARSRSSLPGNQSLYRLHQARRARHRGLRDEAAERAMASYKAALKSGTRLWEMIMGLCAADCLIDSGHISAARPLLSRSRELIEQAPVYECWRAVLMFSEAWLSHVTGDNEAARTYLRHALVLARTGTSRYYFRFVECALPHLLLLALEEGIEVDLAQETIGLFHLKAPQGSPDSWPWPVRIYTLGRFEVLVRGERLEFSRKLPRKTLLFLKSIVAYGGRDVPEQALCDGLWGDEEGDAAHNALSITVLRLRKLLGSNETILHMGGKVSLNPECCWVDAWVFEARVAEGGAVGRKALDLYGGSFLPEDEGESWSVAARERLRGRFIHALSTHGTELEVAGDLQGALDCYLRGIDADPVVETFYQGLMRTYARTGKRAEAFSVYRRLKQTLSVVLGVPPTDATTRLFQELLGQQSADGQNGNG
jgi:LuxR family transcriptional regulator, maltose regulon positive regulatory protein